MRLPVRENVSLLSYEHEPSVLEYLKPQLKLLIKDMKNGLVFTFVHDKTSTYTIVSSKPRDNWNLITNDERKVRSLESLFSKEQICLEGSQFLQASLGRPWPDIRIRNIADIKNLIWRNPYVKGVLIDHRTNTPLKFRIVKPEIGDDLFDKRFDLSKVKTDFQHWLYHEIHDLYLENEWDDPRIDQIHGKREELWKRALLLFRLYEQRVTHIEDLPYGVNPTTLPLICQATVNRAIKAIKKVK
jgi:hypothetical protein